MGPAGGYGLEAECSRHDDPAGADVADHAVRQTLAVFGIADMRLGLPVRPIKRLIQAAMVDRPAGAPHGYVY